MEETKHNLYIIAGCNGAGKTTASFTVLPEMLNCKEFVNADEIARGLSPFNPEGVAIEAGRLMISRIIELLKEGTTFAFETTLATRSYVKLIRQAQKRGYFVTLLFFSLETPEQAVKRVEKRVSEGGHNIAIRTELSTSSTSTLPCATTGHCTTTAAVRHRRWPTDIKTTK
jgi:predicted ABC-type ATPase